MPNDLLDNEVISDTCSFFDFDCESVGIPKREVACVKRGFGSNEGSNSAISVKTNGSSVQSISEYMDNVILGYEKMDIQFEFNGELDVEMLSVLT